MTLEDCYSLCRVMYHDMVKSNGLFYIRVVHIRKESVKFGITDCRKLELERKLTYRRDKPRNANFRLDGMPLPKEVRQQFWWQVVLMFLQSEGLMEMYDSSIDSVVTESDLRSQKEADYRLRLLEECLNRDWRTVLGGNLRMQ